MGRSRPQLPPVLPCLCGTKPTVEQYKKYTNDQIISYRVVCPKPECGKTGPIYPLRDDAIANWNLAIRTKSL